MARNQNKARRKETRDTQNMAKIHSQDSWRENTFTETEKKKTRRKYSCAFWTFIHLLHPLTYTNKCAYMHCRIQTKKNHTTFFLPISHEKKKRKNKNIKSSFSFFNFCAFHRFSYVKRMQWNGGVSGRKKKKLYWNI